MKTVLILVALCGFVCGAPMEYTDGHNPPCERLNVDAVFTTTATKNQTQIDSKTVMTNSDSFSKGTCTNSSRNLAITFNDTEAKWTLIFSAKEQEAVNVTMMFQYKAPQMFPGKDLTDVVILTEIGKLVLSSDDKSFKCDAAQTIQFKPFTSNSVTYTASLEINSLQVQAFNLPSAQPFSEATDCAQDKASTPDAETTTAAEDTTTEEKSTTEESTTTEASTSTAATTTTAASTTTTAPMPDKNTFTVKDDNETCIIMTVAISISVSYPTKDNKTAMANFNVPKTATASGSCGNSTENSTLTVKFGNNSIDFLFMDSDKKAEIEEVTLIVMQDATNFPNAKNTNQKLTLNSASALTLSDDTTFYMCNTGNVIKLGASSLDLTDFQVQAFNLKNDNFTGTGLECDADKSSSTSSSTTMMTTTAMPTPSNPPVNNFTVSDGNVTCLLMKASLVLEISYVTKNGTNADMSVVVPTLSSSDSFNGTCGNVTQTLNIMFFDNWEISFTFSGDGVSEDEDLGASVKDYVLNNVSVTFQYDDHLPNANMTGSDTAHANGLEQFKVSGDGSYLCNAKTDITADKNVKIVLSNFQYQAFQTGNSAQFTGTPQECEADTETNSIVPIAVGAALAGLVVIVLIAYLIGRRKSRRAGYESV